MILVLIILISVSMQLWTPSRGYRAPAAAKDDPFKLAVNHRKCKGLLIQEVVGLSS